MTKPDFIIIGAMKSATSTLHEQLAMQSGIYMSTPKEPNYFSDDTEYGRGEQWYESLFENAAPTDLCGESSTHYTKLPDYPSTIERMAKRLKSPRLIYVMRHPIDRLISHYMHQWSQRVIKCDINEAIDKYEELTAYSCYAKQLKPYFKQFGQENILPVFTESIRVNPQKELEKVASFIGYRGKVTWFYDLEAQNTSGKRFRKFPGYDLLVDSALMAAIRRRLIPQSIRDRVKKGLTLQNRPEIDATNLCRLIELFDQDLSHLGEYLGVNLSCENYKKLVTSSSLSWRSNVGDS